MGITRAVAIVAMLSVAAGCGKTVQQQSAYEMGSLQLDEMDTRLAFGRAARPKTADKEALDTHIARQISRLSGPAWEEGCAELSVLGASAISALIPLLDDQRPTYASRNARPGIANFKTSSQLTLGELSYSLLRDILVQRSDYEGNLPPFNKASWEDWWKRNNRSVRISARMVPKGAQVD